jgi:hypothetical protein
MTTRIALLLLLFLNLLLPPATAKEPKHFVAVYSMPHTAKLWSKFDKEIDLFFVSENFADFPVFLEIVRQKAGKRHIDLDLDMHGNDSGLAMFDGETHPNTPNSIASVGYICNKIDERLDPKRVTLLLESCYSGRALAYTLNKNSPWDGKFFEDHPARPKYPIYGIGAKSVSIGNLIYLQYRSGKQFVIEDIRRYEHDDLGEKIEDYKNSPYTFWLFLLFVTLYESAMV